jgi:hypothetical protein
MHLQKYNQGTEIVVEDFEKQGRYLETAFGFLVADFLSLDDVVAGIQAVPTATPSMAVRILEGRIYQEMRQGQLDDILDPALVIVSNTSGNPRIDRIVAQYQAIEDEPQIRNKIIDVVTRQITQEEVKTRVRGGIAFQVLQGISSPNPAPPPLPEGWLPIAQVRVGKEVGQILEADIIDERKLPVLLGNHTHDNLYAPKEHQHDIGDIRGLMARLFSIPTVVDAGKIWGVKPDGNPGWIDAQSGEVGDTRLLTLDVKENELKLNGAELSRTTYAKLWDYASRTNKVISEAEWQSLNTDGSPNTGLFSAGDGENTFRLPDHRGMYYSVLDEGRGNDADGIGRTLGQIQGDAIRNIEGQLHVAEERTDYNPSGAFRTTASYSARTYRSSGGGVAVSVFFDPSMVVPTGDRNRPINIGVFSVIRYK